MANEFVVRKGLIVSGSAEVENAVIARSITGSFSGSLSAPGSNTQVVFNNAGTLAADSGLVYSSGNVGIGTTSPSQRLQVAGTSSLQHIVFDTTNAYDIGTSVTRVRNIWSSGAVVGNTGYFTNIINYNSIAIGGGADSFTATARLHVSGADNTNMLRISSPTNPNILFVSGSGAVGVGTTTPGVNLDVVGNIRASNFVYSSLNQTQVIRINSTTHLAFQNTGSVEVARFDNAGNWGLGTTAPDSKLHVVGTVKFQDDLIISGSTPAITLRETGTGTGDAIIVIGGQKMTVYTGRTGTSRNDFWLRVGDGAVSSTPAIFTSGSNGFTGLGTETPNERLEVAGNVRLPNSGRVYLWRDNNNNYLDYNNWITSTGATQTIQNSGIGGITFKTLTDTRMFISSDGNVGIGTTAPFFGNLEVYKDGTNSIIAIHEDAGTAEARLHFRTGGNDTIFRNTADRFIIDTESATSAITFTPNGNLGIGITTPSQKLHVAGDALITGSLTVQGTITAKEFKTEFVSASITYASGSHKFGDTADDIHQFTGSVFINGPLTATSFTGSFSGSVSGPVTAPGSDTQIVFNNAGLLSADSGLVYSGSNVGIGTASPTTKLEVNGVIRTPQMSIGGFDSGRNQLLTYTSGPVFRMFSTLSQYASLGIGSLSVGASYAAISGSQNTVLIEGSVGIGTTSPSYKLSIVGAAGQQLELINSATSKSWRPNVNGSDFYITETGVGSPFVIQAGGNVGIGNTAPAQKLDVIGSTQVSGQFAQGVTVANKLVGYGAEFRSNGASAQIVFGRDGSSVGSGAIGADVNHSFAVFTTSSFGKQFVVSQAGNVGVGTTSPSTTLNVIGSTGDFKLERTGYTSFVQLGLPSGVPTIVGNGNLALGGNGAYTTHMFISASGNIGIGTTNPVTQLTVKGSSANTGVISGTTIEPASNFVPSNNIGNLTVGFNTTTADSYLYSGYSNGALIFGTRIAPDNFERMRITASGNVGIGTISPQRRLHVDASGSANSDLPLALTSVDANNRSGILFASSSLAAGKQHRLYHRVNTPNVEWLLSANAGETATWNFLPVDDTNFGVSIRAPRNGGTAFITTGVSQSLLSIGAGGVGNQHLNIASTGNVGIGTTAPANILELDPPQIAFNLSALPDGNITLTNNSSGANAPTIGAKSLSGVQPGLQFIAGTSDANTGPSINFSARSGSNIDFTTLTSTAYRFARFTTPLVDILRNGNVGIGTTSPVAKLQTTGHIVGGLSDSNTPVSTTTLAGFTGLGSFNSSSLAENIDALYLRKGTTDGGSIGISFGAAGGDSYFVGARIKHLRAGSNSNGHLVFETKNDSSTNTTAERMRITDGGNVGIGTTSPSSQLDIRVPSQGTVALSAGFSGLSNLIVGTSTGYTTYQIANGNFRHIFSSRGETGTSIERLVIQGGSAITEVQVTSSNFIVETNALYVSASGNTGLGTTAPSERLHVSGSIRVTGAYYDSSNSSGSAGQVLASTSGGTDWVSLSEISGVDGTGGANQVAFWSDTDTITGVDTLQWDGSKLTIVGTLEATEKSFVIDHPTRPGNKLVYGVLEGPEHAVYCRGRINGQVLQLPEEWTGLVDQETITVQLTPIGKHQSLYVDSIAENTVIIKNADLFSSKIDAFYFIQGTRKDIKPLQTVRPA